MKKLNILPLIHRFPDGKGVEVHLVMYMTEYHKYLSAIYTFPNEKKEETSYREHHEWRDKPIDIHRPSTVNELVLCAEAVERYAFYLVALDCDKEIRIVNSLPGFKE